MNVPLFPTACASGWVTHVVARRGGTRWSSKRPTSKTTSASTPTTAVPHRVRGLHLTERFTRIDADTIDHRYTGTDPTIYAHPWTAAVPMTRFEGPMFEYACHEGNIGLEGILTGARAPGEVSFGRVGPAHGAHRALCRRVRHRSRPGLPEARLRRRAAAAGWRRRDDRYGVLAHGAGGSALLVSSRAKPPTTLLRHCPEQLTPALAPRHRIRGGPRGMAQGV